MPKNSNQKSSKKPHNAGSSMNKWEVTLIQYKTFFVDASDAIEAKESQEVRDEMASSDGWNLADAQVEIANVE